MKKKDLRSKEWFDNPKDPGLTALYLERYLNYGLKKKDLQSGKPIIGIAQSGSDLSPCNRHFQSLSKTIKDGIREAGGVPMEFQADSEGKWRLTLELFKTGGGKAAASELEVPFLGSLPFDPGIVRGGDDGVHRIISEPEGETALAFEKIVSRIMEELDAGSSDSLKIT